jgi:hypothetical protein
MQPTWQEAEEIGQRLQDNNLIKKLKKAVELKITHSFLTKKQLEQHI